MKHIKETPHVFEAFLLQNIQITVEKLFFFD